MATKAETLFEEVRVLEVRMDGDSRAVLKTSGYLNEE
jgi:hypothetical protein